MAASSRTTGSQDLHGDAQEVKRCTKEGITTHFMLDRRPYLKEFVGQVTRINKGRAFFTTPDHLGEYILVDYVANKGSNYFEAQSRRLRQTQVSDRSTIGRSAAPVVRGASFFD
jgi:hypothetical protein